MASPFACLSAIEMLEERVAPAAVVGSREWLMDRASKNPALMTYIQELVKVAAKNVPKFHSSFLIDAHHGNSFSFGWSAGSSVNFDSSGGLYIDLNNPPGGGFVEVGPPVGPNTGSNGSGTPSGYVSGGVISTGAGTSTPGAPSGGSTFGATISLGNPPTSSGIDSPVESLGIGGTNLPTSSGAFLRGTIPTPSLPKGSVITTDPSAPFYLLDTGETLPITVLTPGKLGSLMLPSGQGVAIRLDR